MIFPSFLTMGWNPDFDLRNGWVFGKFIPFSFFGITIILTFDESV